MPATFTLTIEEVGLLADDALVEGLETQPAGKLLTNLTAGDLGLLGIDGLRRAGRFGEELRLAGALHRDEPPRGGIDGLADRQQTVVLEDDRLGIGQRMGDALAFLEVEHDTAEVVVERVIAVERARVLRERIQLSGQRRPGLAVKRMGVRGADNVGAGGVHLRVNAERGAVHIVLALDDLAVVVHKDQV